MTDPADLILRHVTARYLASGARSSPPEIATATGLDETIARETARDLVRKGVLSREVDWFRPSARTLRFRLLRLSHAARAVIVRNDLRARASLTRAIYA